MREDVPFEISENHLTETFKGTWIDPLYRSELAVRENICRQ